ncbi:unnamed protein product [Orchesella dallaii]|uniref:Transmembrane and coiled-coil domains protein 1 n=1 Tax=Orchesella dallaii TaxID=48710 RepID=A0ABP1S9K3_9HEXA
MDPDDFASTDDTPNVSSNSVQTPSIQQLQDKISKAKFRIQEEQRRRDTNVEEYLQMAASAHRNQLPQVKAVFEKRNTKAAATIAALQKKLERYSQQLQEREKEALNASPGKALNVSDALNTHELGELGSGASGSSTASSHRASKGRLQNVSHGIKTVIAKPREIASYLLKHNIKSGSADNIPSAVARDDEAARAGQHHGSAHIPPTDGRYGRIRNNQPTLGGVGILNSSHPVNSSAAADEEAAASECSESAQSSSLGPDGKLTSQFPELALILQQIGEIKDDVCQIREDLDTFKNQAGADSQFICQGLQEERFRAERLEEQVNDLTELHQAETGNLKQALADAEEKLSYQSEERLRDLAEMLEACQTKISRLEQQQQQLVTIEGIENSAARALAVRLVNVGLTMLQLLLLLMATIASVLAPFLGSRIRLVTSLLVGIGAFVAHKKWPQAQEYLLEFWSELLNHL